MPSVARLPHCLLALDQVLAGHPRKIPGFAHQPKESPGHDSIDRLPHPHGQCDPRSCDGRRAGGQLRPPGCAHGHGRHRRGAVGPPPQAQPGQPALGGPRPLRAEQRPRLHADLRAAAPHGLRAAHRGAAQLPPDAQQDAGPPGSGHHRRCRDDDRPAGPGRDQRRGPGPGREADGARLQPRRPHGGGPPHLRLPGRRLPDGRHQPRGRLAGRRVEAEQADRHLRRQRHLHRRPGRALVCRQHGPALRGLRLERHRPGGRP